MRFIADVPGVPNYELTEFASAHSRWCLLVPVLNEAGRLESQLARMLRAGVSELCDVVICDGGSTDGCVDPCRLQGARVNALIVKTGPGKQGAQVRAGIHFALSRNYEGVLTVDGNGKDSVECAPLFVEKLIDGYGYVQGSRFLKPGRAVNTPCSRYLALRMLHAPVTSFAAGHHFTDTTNAFRAYSAEYLRDPRVAPLRDVFAGYELLAYLAIRATQVGYSACEVPVIREYPADGPVPTKISPFRGNAELLRVLLSAAAGKYDP